MPPEPLDEIRSADDDACLRTAEELVAGEAHEVRTRAEALGRGRFVAHRSESAGAKVVDERNLVLPRHRRELAQPRLLRKSDDSEVRLVHAKQQSRVGAYRPRIVGRARAVGRSDLDEARP